jgi:Ca-activated chloride channel family protein
MDFQYPFMLWLLLFVPLLGFLFWLAYQHNQNMRAQFGDWVVFQRLIPDYVEGRSPWKFGLAILAYILLVFAVANPRMGSRIGKIKREGVDVYIAMDISRSMWAKDVVPNGIDRLEKARMFSLNLIDELRGERIGLIFFAGEAFLQMPLTTDYSAAELFLHDGMGDYEIVQGTAIDEVLELAKKSGQQQSEEEVPTKTRQKAVILISDGEEHDQKGVEAAKDARQYGVRTFTVAVGSSKGSPIPLNRDGQAGYHTDKSDQVVKTAVNKVWLKEIAEAGGGSFFEVEKANAARQIHKTLGKMEKGEFDEQKFDQYETYYQYLVFIALLLLIAEFMISYRKSNANRPIEEIEVVEEKSGLAKIEARTEEAMSSSN